MADANQNQEMALATISGRRSVRAFLDRSVSRRKVEEILPIASHAPSGSNNQHWRVHVPAKAGLSAAILAERASGAPEPALKYRYYPDHCCQIILAPDPCRSVVFNNSALGFIEIEQKSSGFLDFGTSFKNPNFAAMAEAAGVRGIRLEDPADVEAGIAAALAHDGPVLIDAVVSRMVLPIPPAITAEMAKGFTLYMVKAVLDGRASDLVDLARTNLWA